MKKQVLSLLAVAAISVLGGVAHADVLTDGAYAGGSFNRVTVSAEGFSGSENFLGAYGGYREGSVGGEVGYAQKTVDGEKATFLDMSFVRSYALSTTVDLLGQVGLRHSTLSAGSESVSGNSLLIGIGAVYKFSPQVAARAMLNRSNKSFGENLSATTLTAGVQYKF